MSSCSFRFHGIDLVARPSGALFWPARSTLVVADLHLGKSERMARLGGALLPPFETQATMERLLAEMHAVDARRLICLGDSFDDDLARTALRAGLLEEIAIRCETLWITGNHDPMPGDLPGHVAGEVVLDGVTLRHIAGNGPDISGHYHPKLRFRGQRLSAFLLGPDHLILPAFGTYTGGLDHDAPALFRLIPEGVAILTGRAAHMVPLGTVARSRLRS